MRVADNNFRLPDDLIVAVFFLHYFDNAMDVPI